MPHEFEIHMEIELDATPEQIWDAIATGPGINSWFMGRTEVEPGTDGVVRTALGNYVQENTVIAWEPLKHFGYRGNTGSEGSFLAVEWLIEGREGASTVLRSVGSGFIGNDNWEAEYDSLRGGGAFYFHNLAQYLTHFAGRVATPVSAMRTQPAAPAEAWAVLHAGLGLPGPVREGERVRLAPAGLDPIDGVVDYCVAPKFLGVRTDAGLYRFYQGAGGMVAAEHHLFATDVDRTQAERAWQNWLGTVFA